MPDYCAEEGCTRIATHQRPEGMAWDMPVVELVCSRHAGPHLRFWQRVALRKGW